MSQAQMFYRAPVGADLPAGADSWVTGLSGVGPGETSTSLRLNHCRAIAKTLPTLYVPLLHSRTAGDAALRPRPHIPATHILYNIYSLMYACMSVRKRVYV